MFGLAADIGLETIKAVLGLVIVALILVIARLIIRIAALFFDRVERGLITVGSLDQDTAVPTRRIFQILIAAIAIALAFPPCQERTPKP